MEITISVEAPTRMPVLSIGHGMTRAQETYAGCSKCREKANSAVHAMNIAEVFLNDK